MSLRNECSQHRPSKVQTAGGDSKRNAKCLADSTSVEIVGTATTAGILIKTMLTRQTLTLSRTLSHKNNQHSITKSPHVMSAVMTLTSFLVMGVACASARAVSKLVTSISYAVNASLDVTTQNNSCLIAV